MNELSPLSRVLATVSTLGMCLLIGNAVIRFSGTTAAEWTLLLAVWLLPAATIVLVERRARQRHS